jgi:hypothetical protein
MSEKLVSSLYFNSDISITITAHEDEATKRKTLEESELNKSHSANFNHLSPTSSLEIKPKKRSTPMEIRKYMVSKTEVIKNNTGITSSVSPKSFHSRIPLEHTNLPKDRKKTSMCNCCVF